MASFLLHRSLRSIAKLLKARDWNPGAIPVGMTDCCYTMVYAITINKFSDWSILSPSQQCRRRGDYKLGMTIVV